MFRTAIYAIFALSLWPLAATRAVENDVRVLIDVSGSMRKNDPRNLRVPALQLFVNIIPNKSRAAIWAFSTDVAELAPLEEINDFWRERALAGAQGVHSRGQRTDIESALARATANPSAKTSVLLLTDGVVDVSQNEGANQKSRERIRRMLPVLRASGVTINTVALSDRADHALLEELSLATGGWYERTNSADDLQRLFFRMFERSANIDSVPLVANRFRVDASVKELTLVVFRTPKSASTRLVTPQRVVLTETDSGTVKLRWTSEAGYDLVTISDPEPGRWEIEAAEDPDNRVLVVTDLKLVTNPLPSYAWPGDQLALRAALTEHGARITDPDFLGLVRLQTSVESSDGRRWAFPMLDDGERGDVERADGEHTVTLDSRLDAGAYEITIQVETDTFARERRHTLTIVEPLQGKVEPAGADAHRFVLSADERYVDLTTLSIDANLHGSGTELTQLASNQSTSGLWTVPIDELQPGITSRFNATVTGQTNRGRPFSKVYGPFELIGPEVVPDPPQVAPTTVATPRSRSVEVNHGDIAEADWLFAISVVAGANLLLGGLGFLWWRRRRNDHELDALFASEALR